MSQVIMHQTQVILENVTGDTLALLSMRRAVVLLLKGKATLVEADVERKIRSAERELDYPLVIRLVKYVWIPFPRLALSRKGVLMRDGDVCQYAGCRKTINKRNQITIDHVIPRSRGGDHSWENVVAACYSCNNHKANRTPEEAGMRLVRKPFTPDRAAIILLGKAHVSEVQRTRILDYANRKALGG